MDAMADDGECLRFLTAMQVGDLCSGTVAEVSARGVSVTPDGFPTRPLGRVGSLDVSWRWSVASAVQVGRRITAEVIAVDLDQGCAWLSMAAVENPELWAFLTSLRAGEVLSGRVARIEGFGVFVALDDGPAHPVYPGVGFITIPELSWQRFDAVTDVVAVGQRISCTFLAFDTTNGEARLSLRAMEPDPFHAFADAIAVGERLQGRVTQLVPFGAFVRVADGIEGLVHLRDLGPTPVEAPEEIVQVGDEITVVAREVDRSRRRLSLSLRHALRSR
ncbi:S1 RNA-binding domain-containing protein [Streptomyces sp. NPDC093801]|uniref:S1 RNA-binding domain-containing protein n=1 Tax=Streptomyces sp. NPDC093801 TaxID=3155203 RepID=UPI00344B6089